MEYIGKNKVNGRDIYKFNNKFYYLEGENFIKIEELTRGEKQLNFIIEMPKLSM